MNVDSFTFSPISLEEKETEIKKLNPKKATTFIVGSKVSDIMMDLSKAFDCLRYDLLITKLHPMALAMMPCF